MRLAHFPLTHALLACVLAVSGACSNSSGGSGGTGGFGLPVGSIKDGQGSTADGKSDGQAAQGGDSQGSVDSGAVLGDGEGSESDTGLSGGVDVYTVDPSDPNSSKDQDGDGYTPLNGDCDDKAPTTYPGALDVCDGVDNDCDGGVDNFDADKDGYPACPGPNQDCDDNDAQVHPKAKADCTNGKDNDCSGAVDADEDADNDGYYACDDCDDKSAAIFPGAPENCKNNKDNNCDGTVDSKADADNDGTPQCSDCDDYDPQRHPGLIETCDSKDNDCNDLVDDMDNDGDSYSGCGDDCDDSDITVHPGATRNCLNGKDNDCSGKVDANEDGDGDGYAGCADCNENNKLINPGAIEFPADNVDNNCDAQTDEDTPPCDVAGLSSGNVNDYAKAIDLCIGVKSSAWFKQASSTAHAIKSVYGPPNVPTHGPNMMVISSGVAAAEGQAGYTSPQSGTNFNSSGATNPSGKCQSSGSAYDYTELKLTIQVPTNAQAFAFDFNFMSAEYPEYVGTSYNDKFMAILDSKNTKGNISFDSKGGCISINNGFFGVCDGCSLGSAGLAGTGYQNGVGGGTGWLTTTSPVTPGETITLRFIIFDESDGILDSVALVDNFRWQVSAKSGGPSTVRPGG